MVEKKPLTSIRGVAALWVVGYHLTTHVQDVPAILPGVFELGFAGVDLFFVLSGFILVTVHPRLVAGQWGSFMVRRVFRVYPLHLAVMGLLGLGVFAAGLGHVTLAADGHYDWAGFLPSALLFKWVTPDRARWNAPSWSIAAELVCYTALPFVLPQLMKASRRVLWGAAGFFAIAAGVWLGAVLSGVLVDYVGASEDAMLGWPGVVRGIFGFALGAVLANLFRENSRRLRANAWVLEALACVLLAGACAIGQVAAIPVVSGLLIVALSLGTGPLARLLCMRPLHWLGRVSFSLYLLHEPMISVISKLPWARLPVWSIAPLRDALVLAVALSSAALTYRWIEEPGRRLPERLGLLRSRVGFRGAGDVPLGTERYRDGVSPAAAGTLAEAPDPMDKPSRSGAQQAITTPLAQAGHAEEGDLGLIG